MKKVAKKKINNEKSFYSDSPLISQKYFYK